MTRRPRSPWWSTVLRVPTPEGDLFFKAVAPVHHFEAGLTAKLAELQPTRVPELVDVDAERAWMLMRDGEDEAARADGRRYEPDSWEALFGLWRATWRLRFAVWGRGLRRLLGSSDES